MISADPQLNGKDSPGLTACNLIDFVEQSIQFNKLRYRHWKKYEIEKFKILLLNIKGLMNCRYYDDAELRYN